MILADILPNFYEQYHENQQLIPKGNIPITLISAEQHNSTYKFTTQQMKRVIFTLPRIVLSFSLQTFCFHCLWIL